MSSCTRDVRHTQGDVDKFMMIYILEHSLSPFNVGWVRVSVALRESGERGEGCVEKGERKAVEVTGRRPQMDE